MRPSNQARAGSFWDAVYATFDYAKECQDNGSKLGQVESAKKAEAMGKYSKWITESFKQEEGDMSQIDDLVVAISQYGEACITEGAFIDMQEKHKEYKEKREEKFVLVLNEIGKYRDSLINRDNQISF